MPSLSVKICGLTSETAVRVALENGAEYVGFVFYPPSPRNISADKAKILGQCVGVDARTVAVMVNPQDADIERLLQVYVPDYIQLHGGESLQRVEEVKANTGVSVIKAVTVRSADDIAEALVYQGVADMLLFDARAPENGLPGGNGLTFDWHLLEGREFSVPWFLSGGLNSENIAEAVTITRAGMVDVSSSLERHPGEKDPLLMKEFMDRVKSLL